MKTALLFLVPALLAAQVLSPNPGLVRFAGLPIENVLGLPGNLLLAPSPFPAADAISFSDRVGLIAASGRIQLVRKDGTLLGETNYAGFAPVLNIGGAAESAIGWLPSERTLLYWRGGQFQRVPVVDDFSKIASVALLGERTARLFLSNADGTVSIADISLDGGTTRNVTILPGAHAPAYAFGADVLYRDDAGLEIEHASGIKHTLVAPAGSFSAERMSDSWVHLYFAASKSHYALHLTNEPTLWQMPMPSKVAK